MCNSIRSHFAWLGSSKSCQKHSRHVSEQVNACSNLVVTMCISLVASIHYAMALECLGLGVTWRCTTRLHSTCNLVDVQMMHGIYIMIDVQMLIIMYTLFIVCHYICCACATLQSILHSHLRVSNVLLQIVTCYLNSILIMMPLFAT